MKWLDPKNNPLPKEAEIIAYIDNKVTTGWMEDELFVDSLHFEEDFSGDNTRYMKKEIMAWMPLPEPIEKKFFQKTFEYYLDFEEEV